MKRPRFLLEYFYRKFLLGAGLILIGFFALVLCIQVSDNMASLYLKMADNWVTPQNRGWTEKYRNAPLNLHPKTILHGSYLNDLPAYNLHISDEGLDSLQQQVDRAIGLGYSSGRNVSYVSATLLHNKKELPCRVRLHGSTKGNFTGRKKSYQVKLDAAYPHLFTSFALITPKQHHYIVPLYANLFAEQFNLYYNQQQPVHLLINGSSKGVYWEEQKLNKNFLKDEGIKNGSIVKLKDTWIEHSPMAAHLNINEIANLKAPGRGLPGSVLNDYRQLAKLADLNEPDSLLQFFDLNYMARFEVYRSFFGVCHDVMWENLKMTWEDGKFYPIVRSEGDLNRVYLSGGSLLRSYYTFRFLDMEKDAMMRAFLLLNKSGKFRLLKYQYQLQMVKKFPQFYRQCLQQHNRYWNAIAYDTHDFHSVKEKQLILVNYLQTLQHNARLIRQHTQFAACYINVIADSATVQIEIHPDGEMPVEFSSFSLALPGPATLIMEGGAEGIKLHSQQGTVQLAGFINHATIMPRFDDGFHLQKTVFTCQVRHTGGRALTKEAIQVSAINAITGEPITGNRLNIAVLNR